ncbi:MAG: Gfo/Idh/MocA family protein [Bacteroidota bacterium]
MKKQRRAFLQQSAAATLGFFIVPRYVIGGKGYTAPSDMINLGFIGTGKQARGLLNSFKDKANIIAGADVDLNKLHYFHSLVSKYYTQARAEGKISGYKGFTAYDDYREIISRKDIDAVVIATPDHWHAKMSIEAANAGKHVYCEKPLAHSVEEGRAMVNAARKNKIVFQTGSMQRSWKNFRHACELVRNGYLGKISEVIVTVGDSPWACDLPAQPVRPGVNWDQWIGPAPFHDFNAILSPPVEEDIFPRWRNYKEYGGGIIADWGAHMFDIAQWALGMDDSGPEQLIPPPGNAAKGLKYVYANGVVMKHEDFGRGSAVRFIGEKGKLDISRSFLESDPANLVTATIQPNEERLYNSNDHYLDWLGCIKTGNKPICDVEVGHRTSSVCLIANIAYALRRPLLWDPKKEQFKNDPEANQLLKPVFREGWSLTSQN